MPTFRVEQRGWVTGVNPPPTDSFEHEALAVVAEVANSFKIPLLNYPYKSDLSFMDVATFGVGAIGGPGVIGPIEPKIYQAGVLAAFGRPTILYSQERVLSPQFTDEYFDEPSRYVPSVCVEDIRTNFSEFLRSLSEPEQRLGIITNGYLKLDPARNAVDTGRGFRQITDAQKKLLEVLITHRGRLITQEDLKKIMWGRDDISDSSIRVAIGRLRTTLGPESIDYLATIRGIGYIMLDLKKQSADQPQLTREAS